MPDTSILDHSVAERARLAGLLADLSAGQWGTPSLCEGWAIREVVAHITVPYRTSGPRMMLGLARARFNINRYCDIAARADTARLSDAELLNSLRDNITHPWRPPGGGTAGALSHYVIHGLDITEPLGLPAAPTDRIATVLAHVEPKGLSFFGVDLTGIRLQATDADYTIGEGAPIALPAKDILLTITGRRLLPQ
ncbi:maleylpyruvate isomerase family mycothiol-dependent enzyme [Nocardia salmonicida]|uniref:maleylpyruvate isomerase family mycothiol-dependent enzyme n=1 Tax=Nocardia salmonicida TaxID=53431 RepID=UPI0037AD3ADE